MKQPRITTKQKRIFDKHVEAWRTRSFDFPIDYQPIKAQIHAEKTSELLWNKLWRNNVSVTSQLMGSDEVFCHMSHSAQRDMRGAFKTLLNQLNIK